MAERIKGNQGLTAGLDRIFTHRIWGFPIFFVVLWIMFVATFRIGAYPMGWIGAGVASLSDYLTTALPEA